MNEQQYLPPAPKKRQGITNTAIFFGVVTLVGFGMIRAATNHDSTPPEPSVSAPSNLAIDHQTGYVDPAITEAAAQTASEDPAGFYAACQELRSSTYEDALVVADQVAAEHGLNHETAVQFLDATILWCRANS
jgi:hypothetical protein